jgi:CheY-like chemotaxis protein
MGGRMWVESEAGRGSVFHFTVVAPAAPDAAPARWQTATSPFAGRVALVADDNAAAREWLARELQRWGLQVAVVASTEEALAWLRDENRCDTVLLDRHMPGSDGPEFAAALREIAGRENLPLLLLSSLAERAPAAEFAAVVSKPLKPAALFDALQRAFGIAPDGVRGAAPADVNDAPPAEPPAAALRVLLVEDNAVNQSVALMMLSKLGYQARLAENGAEALAALAEQPFDVILMDMEMPVMDGCEATRRIRETSAATRPWIVALTANAMNSDRQRVLAAGMNDFVPKPVRIADLSDALDRARAGLTAVTAQ